MNNLLPKLIAGLIILYVALGGLADPDRPSEVVNDANLYRIGNDIGRRLNLPDVGEAEPDKYYSNDGSGGQ